MKKRVNYYINALIPKYSDRDYEIEIDNIVVNAPSIKAIVIWVS